MRTKKQKHKIDISYEVNVCLRQGFDKVRA